MSDIVQATCFEAKCHLNLVFYFNLKLRCEISIETTKCLILNFNKKNPMRDLQIRRNKCKLY